MAKFSFVHPQSCVLGRDAGLFGVRAVQGSDLGRDGDGALQGTPAAETSPCEFASNELLPKSVFAWRKYSEDDCKLKTNRREPRIIYLENILQVLFRVWF